ncbi:MAG: MlaD family protein, partial [Alphaproteobacteria bacterium]
FSKIGGLEVGSDVRISGIKVGSVLATKLNPQTFTADVELSIDRNVRLPIDTVATIADVGVMGDKYVRLEPGKSNAFLKENEVITNTASYKSLEDNISEFIFLSTK